MAFEALFRDKRHVRSDLALLQAAIAGGWVIPESTIDDFASRYAAVMDPSGVLSRVAAGTAFRAMLRAGRAALAAETPTCPDRDTSPT